MTAKAVQKLLTIPLTQEHDEYVFRKQITIPLGMGFTISQSRFPINSKFLVFASY